MEEDEGEFMDTWSIGSDYQPIALNFDGVEDDTLDDGHVEVTQGSSYTSETRRLIEEIMGDVSDEFILIMDDNLLEDFNNDLLSMLNNPVGEHLSDMRVVTLINNGIHDTEVVNQMLFYTSNVVFLSLADNEIVRVGSLGRMLPAHLKILDLSGNPIMDLDNLVVPASLELLILNSSKIPEDDLTRFLVRFRRRYPRVNVVVTDVA